MTRIGIVAALPAEARCLTRRRPRWQQVIEIGGNQLLCQSGLGANPAAEAAQRLVAAGATELVSFGFAGGLDPALPAGALLLPERIVGVSHYAIDPERRERLLAALPGTATPRGGDLLCAATLVATPAQKHQLFHETGALAVDMESAAVAGVAARHGLSLLVLRAVSDPAGVAPPAALLRALRPDGRVAPAALTALLLRGRLNPVSLIRLAAGARAAQTTLRRGARALHEL